MWRVPARRVPLAELLEQRLFGWVGACPGQEGRVLPRLALREEEPRVLDRDGRLRGEERERRQPVGGEGSRDEIVLEVEEPYELMAHDGEAEDRPRRVAGEVRIRRELAGAGRNVLDDHRLPREAHVVHDGYGQRGVPRAPRGRDRKSTRLNSSHVAISYAGICLKKTKKTPADISINKKQKQKKTHK